MHMSKLFFFEFEFEFGEKNLLFYFSFRKRARNDHCVINYTNSRLAYMYV